MKNQCWTEWRDLNDFWFEVARCFEKSGSHGMLMKQRNTAYTSNIIFLLPVDKMASRNLDEDELGLIPDERLDAKRTNTRYRVQEPAASRTRRYLVVLCILFVELCERLTFYGVTVNLVFYCKDVLKLASPLPSTITLAFQGQVSVYNFI